MDKSYHVSAPRRQPGRPRFPRTVARPPGPPGA